MNHPLRLAIVAIVLPLIVGCSYYRPVAVSTSSLGPQYEERLGVVKGRAATGYFLGIVGTDVGGVREAVKDAKDSVGADNLIDVTVDERRTYFPFIFLPVFSSVETIVYGTAIRYTDASLRNSRDRTGDPAPVPQATPTLKSEKPAGLF